MLLCYLEPKEEIKIYFGIQSNNSSSFLSYFNKRLLYNNIMQRKQLPRRSTRGQRPSQLSQTDLQNNNSFYSSLFGLEALQQDQPINPEQQRRQQARRDRKQKYQGNLLKYPYVRAFHYYYQLDKIERLNDHPSYAVNSGELFQWNYQHEQQDFGGQKLGDIINRKYFGLAIGTEGGKKQEGKSGEEWMGRGVEGSQKREMKEDEGNINQEKRQQKNQVVFQTQQKKYGLDRMLYTCKQLRNKLSLLVKNDKIKQFQNIVKREPQLQILAQDASLNKKQQLLNTTIQGLQKKKDRMNHPNLEIFIDQSGEGSQPQKKVKLQ